MVRVLTNFFLNFFNRIRLVLPFFVIVWLVVIGTVGYALIEGWSLADSFFMTVITLSTVGYGEVHQLNGIGRIFTSLLILGGLGLISYSLTSAAALLVEGQLTGGIVRQQIRRRIANLDGHVVVCGYGRVGESLGAELWHEQVPIVVIDHDEDRIDHCIREGMLAIHGDATQDETLIAAGIKRARGLALALDDDAKNVFIALTGRALNPKLTIVSRAARAESEAKLLRAGVDRVVSPYAMSGERMANLITRPNVVRFLENTLRRDSLEFELEEFVAPAGSSLIGRSVAELVAGWNAQVTILAVFGTRGMSPSPVHDHVIEEGDTLIVIGPRHQLDLVGRAFQLTL